MVDSERIAFSHEWVDSYKTQARVIEQDGVYVARPDPSDPWANAVSGQRFDQLTDAVEAVNGLGVTDASTAITRPDCSVDEVLDTIERWNQEPLRLVVNGEPVDLDPSVAPGEHATIPAKWRDLSWLPDKGWIVDCFGGMAIVTTRGAAAWFFEVAEALWTAHTWGELAVRLDALNSGDFVSVFGVETLQEIPDAVDQWIPEEPFSPEQLVTYDVVPYPLHIEPGPSLIEDLYEPFDDEGSDGCLPNTAYGAAVKRLRDAGEDVTEAPGLLDAVLDYVVGGQLR